MGLKHKKRYSTLLIIRGIIIRKYFPSITSAKFKKLAQFNKIVGNQDPHFWWENKLMELLWKAMWQ